jgi:hypothetical protein
MEEENEVKGENLANPMYEDVNVPMCIVSAGQDRFLGGLLELDGSVSTCVLGYPLRYAEFYRQTPDGKTHVDMIIEKVYAYLGIIKEFGVSFDTIYFLHPENREDEFLVQAYYDRHGAIKKRDAGKIEIKEQSRLIIPGVNDVVAANNSKVR